MSTFLQLTEEVLSHQFSETKYREYIKQWLNEAQNYVVLQANLRMNRDSEDYTTVAGTPGLSVPNNFARFISLRNTTDTTDEFLLDMSTRDYDGLPDASGKPTAYSFVDSSLVVYPTPDAAYTLQMRYYALPDAMTVNDSGPELPDVYHHLLVRYALIRCYQRENDYEAADYHERQFEKDLMKLKGQAQHDTREEPKQVVGAWDEQGGVSSSVWW